MRALGIIGGMSWLSTQEYYRLINEGVQAGLGGVHSARLLLSSIDFQGMSDAMSRGEWTEVEGMLVAEARRLAEAGADAILIASNTMHMYAEPVETEAGVPVLHIADAVGAAIRAAGIPTIGLLGTRYSMEKDFYRARLKERFGVETLVPDEEERLRIDRIIFDELCAARFVEESRRYVIDAAHRLVDRGAAGIVLGCTELPLIVKAEDLPVRRFDTLAFHASAAVDFLLDATPDRLSSS
jgi:aspartate racemase